MLHGNIEVNGQKVGYWEAQRGETVMRDTHRYNCEVYYRNGEGHPLHSKFVVVHNEKMGAMWLAHQVIGTGVKTLKGYPPGGDKEFPC